MLFIFIEFFKSFNKYLILSISLFMVLLFNGCFDETYSTPDFLGAEFLPEPEIKSLTILSPTSIKIIFNVSISEGANNITNYSIHSANESLDITSVNLIEGSNDRIVQILTSPQTAGEIYTVTIKNIYGINGKGTPTEGINDIFTGYEISMNVPDIAVKVDFNDANIASGGIYDFGAVSTESSSGAVVFRIENTGVLDLILTGAPLVYLNGIHSSLFSVSQPADILLNPGGSTTFEVTFSPTDEDGPGNKSAMITICSDDPDESSYTVLFLANAEDRAAPVLSDSAISVSNISKNSMNVTWNKAEDNITIQEEIEYRLYYAETSNFSTALQVEANGIPVTDWVKDMTAGAVTGLTAGKTYYINILARDGAGNKTVYAVKTQNSLPEVERICDINSSGSGNPTNFVVFKSKLYFSAQNVDLNEELWVYDPAVPVSGTNPVMVANINTDDGGSAPGSSPFYLTVLDNILYFQASGDGTDAELWKYNGTDAPERVADINPGPSGSYPSYLTVFNGELYFQAKDSGTGEELWKYDGSTSPSLVDDIYSGTTGSRPESLTVFNDKLYFRARSGGTDYELWQCSTSGNTSLVADIYGGTIGSYPQYLTVFDNKLFFQADGQGVYGIGLELFIIDNVNSLSYIDLFLDPVPDVSSKPDHFAELNGKLYFGAIDNNGKELWVYDPAIAVSAGSNPRLLSDINPGEGSSFPGLLTAFNNKLYFIATHANWGRELWVYDPAVAVSAGSNPEIVYDIRTGSNSSNIGEFIILDNKLYFAATDDNGDTELWVHYP